ncbi:MAG: type II 3-dehydroquinate dehydratase [Candidatus Gastranaerophilales bacterium]
MKILIINGANMNMLGVREPEKYGDMTLLDLEKELHAFSFELGINIETFQSNFEGEIIGKIHSSLVEFDGIVINAGAFTHTSLAIADAITSVSKPTIEVHMTNIYKREEFRHKSFIAPVSLAQISGFGVNGYKLALRGLVEHLDCKNK